MADQKSKLASYKIQAGRCQAQLQHASTKDEAFNLAIGVAENLMKALNLAPQEEKGELKEKCRNALDVADKIKRGADWTPPAASQSKGPLAAAPSPATIELYEKAGKSTASLHPSSTSDPPQVETSFAPTVSIQDSHHVGTANELPHRPTHESSSPARGHGQAPLSASSLAPRVHRLKEPLSTRKPTTKERIILLKASIVNGFKFPPWDKDPVPADFALDDGSEKFTDSPNLSLSTFQQQAFQGWLRAEDALPPPTLSDGHVDRAGPQMHSDHPIDLVQDAATDCSVVASLCAGVERSRRGHERILSDKIWPCEQSPRALVLSPNGKYVVRLNFNGCWRKVVVDDRLPVSKTKRQIHVIDRRNTSLLWPALLEKAYLKVRGGYDFPGSNSCSDLWTMTGWIPEEIYLQEAEIVPAQLWKRVYNGFQYGDVLVTLGTGMMTSSQERDLGLESQHSYVVLDMKETGDDRQLLVKNPWSQGTGWRRFSSTMLAEESAVDASSPKEEYPATFWIGLDKVIQHYERLYLNWNPGLFSYRQDVHFEWAIKSNKEACTCIANQPQFSITSKGSDLVFLVLSRHFRDVPGSRMVEPDAFNDGSLRRNGSTGEADKGYMSVFVCRSNGEQIYVKNRHEECTPYVSTPQCLLRFQAVANETYTVVIDQEDLPASTYSFSLSAFSNHAITLDRAAQKYPIQKIEEGAWTKHTAGGATQSPRYFQNPQYTLEVGQTSSLAMLLSSPSAGNPLNVKLAIGTGRRMYKLQSRDMVADSGDYQTGCALAEARDVQPGLYTIICSLFEAGKTGDYTLRVDSTQDFTLRMIARDGAGLLPTKLARAVFRPAVHRIAAPLRPLRNANFTVVSRFERATHPQSHEKLGMLARSPLRLSVELGRGPERRSLITSEGGEYSTTAIVRSESFHLEPGLLDYGDIWVVLERLLGSGGPVEECFDVEVFTDMPDAFSIGAWREWDD